MNPRVVTARSASQRSGLPSALSECGAMVDQLREVGQMFYARGWSVGTSSNYSIVHSRDPLRLLITASGKDKGALTPQDFVLVDQNGRPVGEMQPKSSAETQLHCLIAQHERAGAVLHTHSVWATILSDLFAAEGGIRIEGYEMLKGLDGITTHRHRAWVPIFENSQDIPALAHQVGLRLQSPGDGQTHGFLLRQHGLYTWGQDCFAARRHVEVFEFLFECVARKLMIPSPLPPTARDNESIVKEKQNGPNFDS